MSLTASSGRAVLQRGSIPARAPSREARATAQQMDKVLDLRVDRSAGIPIVLFEYLCSDSRVGLRNACKFGDGLRLLRGICWRHVCVRYLCLGRNEMSQWQMAKGEGRSGGATVNK